MQPAILTIEPNLIKPDIRREYYAPKEGTIFWRIIIDGKEITDRARPFAPQEHYIEMRGDIQIPYYGDGYDFVRVRYTENYVLWFGIDENYEIELNDFSGVDLLYVFDRDTYIQTVNQHRSSPIPELDLSWAMLEPAELKSYLMKRLPRPEDALYRTLENRYDATGEIFLRRLQRCLQNSHDLHIATAPETFITLNIGLDLHEFTECILHIGRDKTGYIVQFEQNPAFPFWLRSTAFDEAFRDETFSAAPGQT